MRFARQMTIDAPPGRVWALLDDERNLGLWMPGVVATRYPDGRPAAGTKPVGTRFVQTLQQNNQTSEYSGEITDYVAGERMGFCTTTAAFRIDARYYVTAAAGAPEKTTLVYTCDTMPVGVLGWLLMLGGKLLGKIADQQLAGLKRAAEDPDTIVYGAPKGPPAD